MGLKYVAANIVDEMESSTACTTQIHFELESFLFSKDSSHNNVASDDELNELRRFELVTTSYFSSLLGTGWYCGKDISSG
jgi:hypothetical protein